jgi:hypothetical protein
MLFVVLDGYTSAHYLADIALSSKPKAGPGVDPSISLSGRPDKLLAAV